MSTIDLEAYFKRIGYTGTREPSLATLREIHRLHPQAIAFENLSPVLRWPVPLDVPSLERKLIHAGRGGYCFEQNRLLATVLTRLGFPLRTLGARVAWNYPPGALNPRGHMLMLVEADGAQYVADVGFGGLVLTAPLRFEVGIEQETPHERFRIIEELGYFTVQGLVRGEWKTTIRFDLSEQVESDYEVASWYLCNHPESHFIHTLMAARPAPGLRYALRNNSFTTHHMNGESVNRVLTDAGELYEVLTEIFAIRLERSDEVLRTLGRFTES